METLKFDPEVWQDAKRYRNWGDLIRWIKGRGVEDKHLTLAGRKLRPDLYNEFCAQGRPEFQIL